MKILVDDLFAQMQTFFTLHHPLCLINNSIYLVVHCILVIILFPKLLPESQLSTFSQFCILINYVKTIGSNLCCPNSFESEICCGAWLTCRSHTLRENWFSISQHLWARNPRQSPTQWWDFIPTSSRLVGVLSGLSLQRSCVCYHNHYVLFVIVLLCCNCPVAVSHSSSLVHLC